MIEFINRISAAEDELKMLGMEKRQRGNLKIIITNVVVLALKSIELAVNPSTPDGLEGILYGIFSIAFIVVVLHNTILIFVHNMTRIGRCFESLNEKLWDNPELKSPYSVDNWQL